MKKSIFILLFINSIVFSQEIQPSVQLEGVWILDKSFSDEFDKSKLDETRWWDFNPAWHDKVDAINLSVFCIKVVAFKFLHPLIF